MSHSSSPLRANRSMAHSVVIPVLTYLDVSAAAQWLCRTFGFTERLRIGNHRVQLCFGEGAVVAAARPGSSSSPACHSVMVRVPDIDEHHQQARQLGARILSPPADYPYGERQYTAEDLGGHVWTFSQTIADVDPATWGGELIE